MTRRDFIGAAAMGAMLGSTAGDVPAGVIDIGNRLELFVDRFLIDKVDGLTRRLHSPQRREVWKPNRGVSALVGKPVRLRFMMKDADLYAIRFP